MSHTTSSVSGGDVKTFIAIIIIGLVASVHRGDPAEEYVFVRDVAACVGGMGDWPESYEIKCEGEFE